MNRLQLIGRLGRDPESRTTPRGLVTTFSVATNEYWKDSETGEMQTQTQWHTCVCFDRWAEVARDHLRKGDEVYVEGRIKSSQWKSRDGFERTNHEMRVEQLQMLRRSRVDAIASATRLLDSLQEMARKMHTGELGAENLDVLASAIGRVRETLNGNPGNPA